MTNLTFDPDNTLAGALTSMSPREVISLGADLCAAVESSVGSACHGSIWPGNITSADGRIALGPAGSGNIREMSPDALEYIAPEQFWNGENTPAADVYSIGLILYTALNGGLMPFFEKADSGAEARAAALQSRMRGKTVSYPRTAGRELGDVVLKAVAFHKEDRYETPAALRQALLALPEGAAVPAAVPVMPLTKEEVTTAHSYKVDKEFEKIDPPKPRREKKADAVREKQNEEKELEEFRNPKPSPMKFILPLLLFILVVAAIFLLKSCSADDVPDETVSSAPTETQLPETAPPAPTPTPTPTPHPEPTPEPTPTPTPEPTPEPEPSYQLVFADVTWEQAKAACEALGGHLATVRNDAQLNEIISLVEQEGAKFIWLGASRSSADNTWYYVTGEQMTYGVWDTNEPSAFDGDGTPENCLLMWHSRSRDMWCFNDTRNDPISVLPRTYSGKTAYICQFD